MKGTDPTPGDAGDPSRLARAFCSRGELLAQLGRLAGAIEAYTEATRLDPNFADAFVHRALAWSNKG